MRSISLEIGERQLSNGLTLLAVRNPGVRTFAAGLFLDVDLRDETKGEEGLASFVGACLEEGTERHSAVELAEAVDAIGGTLTGGSSGASVQCPAKESGKALHLLSEMVFEPTFPARSVHRVQQETLADIKVEEADPQSVASLRFRKEAYGRHPFGRPNHGGKKSVAGFAPKDLRRFHRRWFQTSRGFAVAAGPEETERSLDMLARTFRGQGGRSIDHLRPRPPALPESSRDIHLPMRREQVHVFLGHPGVRRTHPDFHALLVMDHILGSGPGFTARISRRLRDEQGLCYSVHASIASSAGEEPGCFRAYIGTSAKHRKKAIDGLGQEIRKIRRELVTQRELENVQKYLTGSYVFTLERNSNLVLYALRAKKFDLGFDYLRRYPDLIRSTTREDIRRVAREHLCPGRMIVVSAGAG